MKKTYFILVVVATVAVLCWIRPKDLPAPEPTAVAPRVSSNRDAPSLRMQQLQLGPRGPVQLRAEDKITPECLTLWNQLRGLSLDHAFSIPPIADALFRRLCERG